MKRIISLFIIAVMALQCFSVLVSAANDFSASGVNSEGLLEADEDIGEIHSCVYLPKEEKVTVSGTISHEVMVTHNDYKIALFAVPDGKTLYDVVSAPKAEPLASADISIKFEFEVDAKTNSERFSRYAVVIYNSSGDIKAIDRPKHANVATAYERNEADKSAYKGVSTAQASLAAGAGAGTAIIPVYLEKLLSNASTGYLYPIQGSYIYFDKAYVGELDAMVRSMSAVGSSVYLQFLISSASQSGITTLRTPDTERYSVPDMSSEQSINLVVAFSDFLCKRYDTQKGSHISGIILGSSADTGYSGAYGSFERYAENYAHYLLVAGTVARAVSPELDVVMPFGDRNTYGAEDYAEIPYKPSELLENICDLFDKYFAGGFAFSTMIETSSVPYGISDDAIASGKFSADEYEGINADTAYKYSLYLNALSEKYETAPDSFIFTWMVPADISGSVLSCAYAYTYFKLMSEDRISAFTVSFAEAERSGEYGGYSEIADIMKYIDTADSFKITAPQLKMLGVSNWYAAVDNMYGGRFDTRRILPLSQISSMPANIIGNYAYYDFSYYISASEWFGGSFCDSLKIDYSDISGRSLQAHFLGKTNSPSEFSEIYCTYEYPENFGYTPYMSLVFNLENDSADRGALYEVSVTFGSGENSAEMTRICRAYEKVTMLFDISDFCEVSMAEYIRIGVRCLAGDEGGYKLCLASMNGYSTQYVSSELEALISEERQKIRNTLNEEEDSEDGEDNAFLIVAGIAVVIAVIGVGIFMCFKREEDE